MFEASSKRRARIDTKVAVYLKGLVIQTAKIQKVGAIVKDPGSYRA
jgi:hypothetical protein